MPVGNAFVAAFIDVVYAILNFLWWVLIIGAVMSWLISFNIVNPYNRAVRVIMDIVSRITEPMLAPIRRVVPPAGGLDLAPLVLLFLIYFTQRVLLHLVI